MKQPHRAMGIVHRFISSAEAERPRQTHASPGSPHPKVPTIPAIKKSQPLPGTRELYHRRQQHGGQDRMASATQDSTMHSQATQRRRVHWSESWSPLSSRSSAPISVGLYRARNPQPEAIRRGRCLIGANRRHKHETSV